MKTYRATVANGRMILDEPTDREDGTLVELIPVDEDDLDEEERAALHAAIDRSLDEIEAGRTRPGEEILNELRSRR